MFNSIDLLSFILAFGVLYFMFALLSKLRQQDVFKDRLKELMRYKEKMIKEDPTAKKIFKRQEEQSLFKFKKFINKIQRMGKKEQESLKKTFIRAGLKSDNASLLYGVAKIFMVLSTAALAGLFLYYFTDWKMLYKVSAVLASGLIGSYLVDFILDRLVKKRQERIRKAFPEALDLMVICTEAGLSLTATVQRVAREVSQLSPDLGFELALLSIELNMFSDRTKALINFSDRMDSPYFKSIIANIIQAEQYGTPIAQTMRVIAEQFRQDRLIEAEERAAKLPALLSLPMMIFIFPCIYIVIIGPAAIKVMEVMAH
ncbi:MAG TPA: type II secretion system F family protein [Alphaproteobacteria bacterium]|nr:type II secretion system F family protein [Alphaproteobacteria bacterium]